MLTKISSFSQGGVDMKVVVRRKTFSEKTSKLFDQAGISQLSLSLIFMGDWQCPVTHILFVFLNSFNCMDFMMDATPHVGFR